MKPYCPELTSNPSSHNHGRSCPMALSKACLRKPWPISFNTSSVQRDDELRLRAIHSLLIPPRWSRWSPKALTMQPHHVTLTVQHSRACERASPAMNLPKHPEGSRDSPDSKYETHSR